jgi:hypothetical protein
MRTKKEIEIEGTNWTKLADEWIKAKHRIFERISVTLLPYTDKVHKLPPTSASNIINKLESQSLIRVCIFF